MNKNLLLLSFLSIFSSDSIAHISTPQKSQADLSDSKRLDLLTKKSENFKPLQLPNMNLRERHLDLSEPLTLKGSNFKNANFSGSPCQRKIIRNIDFSSCDLTGANFSYTEIISCTFEGAQLSSANFTGAKITRTRFRKSFLINAIFDETDQESVGFDGSDLRCSSWKKGTIYRVSFSRADERGMKKDDLTETDCSHENVIKSGFFETYSCPCK